MSSLSDFVEDTFSADGALASALPHFEQRAEQKQLARAITRNIEENGCLIAEAGTGIGKTLAYLAPAVTSGKKVVISTGTKNLQEQIVSKDIPILERCWQRRVDVEVMKGRTNYLCASRAERFYSQPLLPSVEDARAYQEILDWRDATETGDRAELTLLRDESRLWRELSASSEECAGRKCRHLERCWVMQMRRRAQCADIVVVNHHLYLADLALRLQLGDLGVSLLPEHDVVIFDEAHDLDEVAAQHFGFVVTERRVQELVRSASQVLSSSKLDTSELDKVLEQILASAHTLFDLLCPNEGRYPLEHVSDASELCEAHMRLDERLNAFEYGVATTALEEAPALERRAAQLASELSFGITSARRPCGGKDTVYDAWFKVDDFVRFSERFGRHRAMIARPIDVAPILGEALADVTSVLLSATLTVDRSFAHFRRRIGIRHAHTLAVGSPFDYERNARLYIPSDLPAPNQAGFSEAACQRAAELVGAAFGGAFVLCTSHRMLPPMREAIARQTGLRVLMQGDAPRSHLIEDFAADPHGVLVATSSFWQGVDVPGLRLVIIDKLPFAAPNDPVVAARIDLSRRRGEEPFFAYQLPHAALLLRQGFGRLIRTQRDRGLVAILDRRLLTHRYGDVFLRSLPPCPQLTEINEAVELLVTLAP